jgi:hypothetical protein
MPQPEGELRGRVMRQALESLREGRFGVVRAVEITGTSIGNPADILPAGTAAP